MNLHKLISSLYSGVILLILSFCFTPVILSAQTVTFNAPELLGRPTNDSITINIVADQNIDAYIEYGTVSGIYTGQTGITLSMANEPNEITITNLQSNTLYYYMIKYRVTGTTLWNNRNEHSFYTQRSPGSTFAFTITSDSHFATSMNDPDLYERTLLNIQNNHADFHIDLGDAFLMPNTSTVTQSRQLYLAHRPYFGIISHSSSLFLAPGNHENEEGWNLDDTLNPANSLPVLSTNARKRYYLNPIPDFFYSGNSDVSITAIDDDQLKEDYYAWQWGDALFIVLDPFWYTMTKPFPGTLGGEANDEIVGDEWDWTLGIDQYTWLKNTLEQSDATFKFMFAHHLVGGTGVYSTYGRGGANAAPYYEWGGLNSDGTWGYDTNRPGWVTPIHQLMIQNDVTAFFHGHDHVYAKEDLDGIVYQECPMAADISYSTGFPTNQTDYNTAVIRANSGHLRVTVSPQEVTVDYIRSFLPGDGTNGTIAYSYTIPAPAGNQAPIADDQNVDTLINTSVDITLTASDPDLDPLDYSIVDGPTNGNLTGTPPEVIYTPDNGYTGQDSFTFKANDGELDSNSATVTISVNDAPTPAMEWGVVSAGGNAVTVELVNEYVNPVVVCSVQYAANPIPVVTRVSNVTPASFDVRLQNPSDQPVASETIHFIVVEQGMWTIDGVKIEAQTYLSTITDHDSSWTGQVQTYGQSYTNPVILGQVMSENDPDFSVFWSQGISRASAPSSSILWTGKTVCEDTDVTRADEIIGFIVVEASHGSIGGTEFEAYLGTNTIEGVGNSPPYNYSFTTAFGSTPQVAVTVQAGMDGINGGWAQLHGSSPVTQTMLSLSIDEDQISDSERQHIAEQVGYFVFGNPGVFP